MELRARILAVVAVLVGVAVALLVRPFPGDGERSEPTPAPAPGSRALVVEPLARTLAPAPEPEPRPCVPLASRPFVPVELEVPGLGSRRVLGLAREASGASGVPPLTSAGKQLVGWDAPGVRPGSDQGNVLLNAHTWPDGSALGNQLLRELDEGEVVTLRDARGQALCYRIRERVEVPFDAPSDAYYDDQGSPQVAIAVCSGTRVGPGEWTHRTLWFGVPVTRAARPAR